MCLDIVSTRKRSRLGLVSDTRGSRLGQFGKRLGLVSVSGAQVLVSVSTQKVLSPSLSEVHISNIYPTYKGSNLFLFLKLFTLFDQGETKMAGPISTRDMSIGAIWLESDPFLEMKKFEHFMWP